MRVPNTELMRRYIDWLRKQAADRREAISRNRNHIAHLINSAKTLEDEAGSYEHDADELEDYADEAEGLKTPDAPASASGAA